MLGQVIDLPMSSDPPLVMFNSTSFIYERKWHKPTTKTDLTIPRKLSISKGSKFIKKENSEFDLQNRVEKKVSSVSIFFLCRESELVLRNRLSKL